MGNGRSSISKATSYQEMSDFWDDHDAADFWDETEPVDFEIDIKAERVYYPISRSLSEELAAVARLQGISVETLLNIWIQERLLKTRARSG